MIRVSRGVHANIIYMTMLQFYILAQPDSTTKKLNHANTLNKGEIHTMKLFVMLTTCSQYHLNTASK